MVRLRGLVILAVAGFFAATAAGAISSPTHGGPLTGTWSGSLTVQAGFGAWRQHIRLTVNARETGGSWRLNAACHGRLKLDSISNGYHHFRRVSAPGSTCGGAGGDIDCLKRAGANIYDAVTTHRGGRYDESGTLHRVTTR